MRFCILAGSVMTGTRDITGYGDLPALRLPGGLLESDG